MEIISPSYDWDAHGRPASDHLFLPPCFLQMITWLLKTIARHLTLSFPSIMIYSDNLINNHPPSNHIDALDLWLHILPLALIIKSSLSQQRQKMNTNHFVSKYPVPYSFSLGYLAFISGSSEKNSLACNCNSSTYISPTIVLYIVSIQLIL